MGQKTNPTSLRLQKTNKYFNSCWYSDYFYTDFLFEELKTRSYIERVFNQIYYPTPQFFIHKLYKNVQLYAFFFDPRGARQEKEHRFVLQKMKPLIPSFEKTPQKWSKKNEISTGLSPFFNIEKTTQIPALISKQNGDKTFSTPENILTQRNDNSTKGGKEEVVNSESRLQEIENYNLKKFSIEGSKKHKQNVLRYLLLQGQLKNKQNLFANKDTVSYTASLSLKHNVFLLSLYDKNNKFTASLTRNLFSHNPHTLSMRGSRHSETSNKLCFKKYFENTLCTQLQNLITFNSIRVLWEYQNACFLADEVVFFLQRRVTFRRIKDHLLKQVKSTSIIKGVRLCCSGRLGGRSKKAQKAKTESVQWGQTSLNVFSSKLCFASKNALTPFGKIGVKLWVCYK